MDAIRPEVARRIVEQSTALLGRPGATALWAGLRPRLEAFVRRRPAAHASGPRLALDHHELLLICYPDQLRAPQGSPLATLRRWLASELDELVTAVHLLPFHPYSSDDGFAVKDYRAVEPRFGSWADIEALAAERKLMLDAVLNHVSATHPWFQRFREGAAPYDRYFITPSPGADTRGVYRPRTHPLLTTVETARGPRKVWTTFSSDQIDLDYRNPQVVREALEVLLRYLEAGAGLIRLDAIGLLCKRPGTSCLHLPETHAFVRLVRAVLDAVAPSVMLVPEINGPLQENLPYLGDGTDEAQLVYHFALPPLVLHALLTGSAARLCGWLSSLPAPVGDTALLNFLASHDGIGVRPAEGVLDAAAIDALGATIAARGGVVNRRASTGGARPYELACTLFDALRTPGEPLTTSVARFGAAHGIMLSLAGLPALYFHSLLGSPNWQQGMAQSGQGRTLNRRKLAVAEVTALRRQPTGRGARCWRAITALLSARRRCPALGCRAAQQVLPSAPGLLVVRRSTQTGRPMLCAINVTSAPQPLRLRWPAADLEDALSGARQRHDGGSLALSIEPYGVRWLAAASELGPR